jgi:hypothetical protein
VKVLHQVPNPTFFITAAAASAHKQKRQTRDKKERSWVGRFQVGQEKNITFLFCRNIPFPFLPILIARIWFLITFAQIQLLARKTTQGKKKKTLSVRGKFRLRNAIAVGAGIKEK